MRASLFGRLLLITTRDWEEESQRFVDLGYDKGDDCKKHVARCILELFRRQVMETKEPKYPDHLSPEEDPCSDKYVPGK